jgi:hypothetical protein
MKASVLQKSWMLVPLVLVSGSCAANSAPTVGIYKLDDQRVSGETTVFGKEASFGDFMVLVTIDTAGNVIKADATDNYQKLDPAPALAAVQKWKFRPQIFDGKPVNAVGRVSVDYRKAPIPADVSIPFPKGEPAETSITLERSACYGTCPDYRVTVHGDGLVQFDTSDDHFRGTAAEVHLEYNGHNVLLPGPHTARIDPAVVAKLLDRFQAAHFFGLKNEYSYGATDASTQMVTVESETRASLSPTTSAQWQACPRKCAIWKMPLTPLPEQHAGSKGMSKPLPSSMPRISIINRRQERSLQ